MLQLASAAPCRRRPVHPAIGGANPSPTMPTAISLTMACLAAVAALLVAERRGQAAAKVVAKLAASTFFVLVAVSLDAQRSTYGQLILGALVLGWIGDALLLFSEPRAFMAGLVAFLLSHTLFAAAFAIGDLSVIAMAIASGVAVVFGGAVLRWLLPHTPAPFKVPVLVYVIVILGMCIVAAGHARACDRWGVLVGAILFAASDLAVARQRFVRPGYINHLWGWPAYFVAQLVFAWTVAGASSPA